MKRAPRSTRIKGGGERCPHRPHPRPGSLPAAGTGPPGGAHVPGLHPPHPPVRHPLRPPRRVDLRRPRRMGPAPPRRNPLALIPRRGERMPPTPSVGDPRPVYLISVVVAGDPPSGGLAPWRPFCINTLSYAAMNPAKKCACGEGDSGFAVC